MPDPGLAAGLEGAGSQTPPPRLGGSGRESLSAAKSPGPGFCLSRPSPRPLPKDGDGRVVRPGDSSRRAPGVRRGTLATLRAPAPRAQATLSTIRGSSSRREHGVEKGPWLVVVLGLVRDPLGGSRNERIDLACGRGPRALTRRPCLPQGVQWRQPAPAPRHSAELIDRFPAGSGHRGRLPPGTLNTRCASGPSGQRILELRPRGRRRGRGAYLPARARGHGPVDDASVDCTDWTPPPETSSNDGGGDD